MEKISIVAPVYNEEKVLQIFWDKLNEVIKQLPYNFEIVFVNDGSNDKSAEILNSFYEKSDNCKIIELTRNFGHQASISVGLSNASADAVVVIVMDADLQDPPSLIPEFIKKWEEEYNVVYAIRKKRNESLLKKVLYFIFYRILKKISNVDIHLDAGDFCLIDREVVRSINLLPEKNRFVRGLRSWVGYRQIGIPCERPIRYAGKPKYTYFKLIRLALDGIVSMSHFPLQVASILGFLVSSISFCGILVVLYYRIFTNLSVPGFASTAILILFLGGVQLIAIGIMGEYIGRIYEEVKQRPTCIIKKIWQHT